MTVDEARRLAQRELADALPRRWRHVQGVAARAAELGAITAPDLDVIQSAAWLHDISYAPNAVDTGFHPLDGARFLRRSGVDERIVTLVAHHTFARIEADERGLAGRLASEFGWEDSPTADLLAYCDLTVGPDGQRMTPVERLAEIRQRYDPADPVHRFIVRAEGMILSTCDQVEKLLGRGPHRAPDS